MRAAAESMADEQAGFCGCVCVCLPAPARSMLADDLAHLLGPAVFKMCRLFLYVVVRRACFGPLPRFDHFRVLTTSAF